MTSTNKTTSIELSQYIGSDIPSYLGDYNNDMLKIDTAIKNIKEQLTNSSGGLETINNKIRTLETLTTEEKEKVKNIQNELNQEKEKITNLTQKIDVLEQSSKTLTNQVNTIVEFNIVDKINNLNQSKEIIKKDVIISTLNVDTKYKELGYNAIVNFENVTSEHLANCSLDITSEYQDDILLETDSNIIRVYAKENKPIKFSWLSVRK